MNPAEITVSFDCECERYIVVRFDRTARAYSRTTQCPCGRIRDVRRPAVVEIGRTAPRVERLPEDARNP